MRAGAPPQVWRLVGGGESEVLDGGARGEGAAAFLEALMRSEVTELLDPNRAAEYGHGPGQTPDAILLIQAAPTEDLPEGLALTLEVGPPLPAELGGGRAVVSGFAGNLLRIPEDLAQALLPSRQAFGDPEQRQRWQLLARGALR